MSEQKQTGVVETISKTSIVVTIGDQATTLTGQEVEALVSQLKLGDQVEFNDDGTGVSLPSKAQTSQTATKARSSSPVDKTGGRKIQQSSAFGRNYAGEGAGITISSEGIGVGSKALANMQEGTGIA